MNKVAAALAALVGFATVTALIWIGMKTGDLERRMCLKQPNKVWSKGECYDR